MLVHAWIHCCGYALDFLRPTSGANPVIPSPGGTTHLGESELLQILSRRVRTREDHLVIERGIASLASERFEERESAEAALVHRGRAALVSLTRARTHSDPEVAKRASRCLEQIDQEQERLEIRSAIKQLRAMGSRRAWPLVLELAAQADRPGERDELMDAAMAFQPAEPLEWANRLAVSARISDRLLAFRLWSGVSPDYPAIAGLMQDPEREIRW